jgi:hypothetical protein
MNKVESNNFYIDLNSNVSDWNFDAAFQLEFAIKRDLFNSLCQELRIELDEELYLNDKSNGNK